MAGAGTSEQRQALLGDTELWSHIVSMPAKEGPSVQELIRASPNTVIATLQNTGVQKVAEFTLPDKLVLGRLGEDKLATLGAQQAELPDYEAAWRQELGLCCSQDAEPLTAAASMGSEWCSEIPVNAYVVSVRDAAATGKRGLLHPLIRRWQANGCGASTFQLPAVQAVIDWKWRFCRKLLIWELALFVVWLMATYVWALAQQVQDAQLSLPELLSSWHGRIAVAAELIGTAAMLPFLYAEVCSAMAYKSHFLDIWRLLDLGTYALQVTILVLHLGRSSLGPRILPVAGAMQCVLLLFRLQFYSRVFPATRFAFIDDLKQVLADLRFYIFFCVLVMFGFSAAFFVLFAEDRARGEGRREFDGLGRSFITMVSWVAGDPNLTLLYGPQVTHAMAACLLGLCYIFCFTLVLMTLLVSLMTTTLQKVTQDMEARQLLSKALIIDELENAVPSLLRRLWPQMNARYIHVLRVDASSLDAIKLDRLWKSLGDAEAEDLRRRTPAATATAGGPSGAALASFPQPMPAPPQQQEQHQLHRHPPATDTALPSTRWQGEPSHVSEGPAGFGGDVVSELAGLREEVKELKKLLKAAVGSGGVRSPAEAASSPMESGIGST